MCSKRSDPRDGRVSFEGPIHDRGRLIREMRPRLHEGTYAFCALPEGVAVPLSAVASFREAEGVSVIIPLEDAGPAGLRPAFECAWITLEVHSALEAVGLTAAVARVLTAADIPSNVVAALHHDHLFVPVDRGQDAMRALRTLTRESLAESPDTT